MGATTPLWVPLVVAIIGLVATIVGTITGVLITQRRSDRRETLAWERERERERERWAREDAARTFDYRRESYVEFLQALDAYYSELVVLRVEVLHPGFAEPIRRELRSKSWWRPRLKPKKPPADHLAPPLPADLQTPLRRMQAPRDALEKLKIYGSTAVAELAEETLETIDKKLLTERLRPDKALLEQAAQKRAELLVAIRIDLHIPAGSEPYDPLSEGKH